ncbi:hypothetical protein [Hyphomonas oceanitis]|uniref:Lipoprotein n=1 Tax=Hyphomonas oceanitis SCH89 TaxID=1280953 RepID=A0A059G8L4_9PROT|nr:hypothetical protein [Hyphomonas oceanitis]KDA03171.1 hypothetical protein HOC_07193 [Hyphomonas oceanitis SCH89]
MAPSLILKAACLGALALGAGATASAGDWRLDPKLCPDIVKDRLDERVSSARPGKADDINHMRQVSCPASAWTYTPAKDEKFKDGPRIYTGSSIVYVGFGGYYQIPPAQAGNTHAQPARVKIVSR